MLAVAFGVVAAPTSAAPEGVSPAAPQSSVGIAAAAAVRAAEPPPLWTGADGMPLPFRSTAEIEDFLATAAVVDRQWIAVGVTAPQRLTLERDGVRADAVFRYFERTYDRQRMRNGRLYVGFTDSFRFEPAAYRLASLLGMDNVPPAVARRVGRQHGTLQMWVYGARMESERAAGRLSPPDAMRWRRQRQQMLLFDVLIGNVDRNAGNVLYDAGWKMWLIDHTRAFYARAPLDDLDELEVVERTLWERLRGLDEVRLEEVLGEHLSAARIGRLLRRRDRVAAHVDRLIAARGAANVLYDAR